ncbi:MAG: hypothetical protein E6K70_09840, partial [Planctomycetota bacterium]
MRPPRGRASSGCTCRRSACAPIPRVATARAAPFPFSERNLIMMRSWCNRVVGRKTKTSRRPEGLRPSFELLEARCLLSGFRTIDGSGNNFGDPDEGQAGIQLFRIAPSAYADGVSAPAGANRPGARAISNALSDQT